MKFESSNVVPPQEVLVDEKVLPSSPLQDVRFCYGYS